MESWRSLKKRNPTNKSVPREVPRTKIERTISLRLIHTYGVDDPAGLRRPELGATGVERREEEPFGVMVEFRSKENARGGSPEAKINLIVSQKGSPISFIYRGGGGVATLEEGAALEG